MKDINATVVVDLTPDLNLVLMNLHKDARWGINRAKRENLTISQTNNESDWIEFYKIYEKNLTETGIKPLPLIFLKEKTSVFYICKKEDKIIAGAGIWFIDIYNKEIPRLLFNASLKEYQQAQPNNLLYWACIEWAKNNGYKEFDLGGWQINPKGNLKGVNEFKEKWGKVIYFKKEYPLHKAFARKLIRNSTFFWKISRKVKK